MPPQITQPPVLTEGEVTTPPSIAVPDQFATVLHRPDHGRLDDLGVVGTAYEPVHYEESCTLLDGAQFTQHWGFTGRSKPWSR